MAYSHSFNALKPRLNGRHFPDDIFKWIFLNKNVCFSVEISLNFAPRGTINNNSALVQIMAWRRPGGKPLSEPMMVRLSTHTRVFRPKWVNNSLRVFLNCCIVGDWLNMLNMRKLSVWFLLFIFNFSVFVDFFIPLDSIVFRVYNIV